MQGERKGDPSSSLEPTLTGEADPSLFREKKTIQP